MTFHSSQNTRDHFLSFNGTDANIFGLFVFDVIVILLVPEGREEVKVVFVDGDQLVAHVTFLSHCTGNKVTLVSASLPADMVSGLYKVPDMLLRSCWLTRA